MITKAQKIYLKDYNLPPYFVKHIFLDFDIYDDITSVKSKLIIEKNQHSTGNNPLILNGINLSLKSITLNNSTLDSNQYKITENALEIRTDLASFELEIIVEINPATNLALEGLYKSGNILCTQNEPEGFRHITYFPDRPDVMSIYTTTIRAARKKFPLLLSNGNETDKGDLENGRHFITYEDPFPKPAYLFALVAGDLDLLEDTFVTKSGKNVALKIYVDKGNAEQAQHAALALKQAMKWDEETYNLEYDLDTYRIVAVDSFNFGAMENKGLNIFNSQYVLADQKTATDRDFTNIQGVVAHEYFHNWTGNRVTCRDWFQITLKEGLTVFRDEEFSADMNSRPVKRIQDVQKLRDFQFPEDSGPMSHPIRPESYLEVNNFYTSTVYEKGAEVIRMVAVLIGKDKFRAGIAKYFELYDGMAVTTDDFIQAMEIASGYDLTLFKNWYSQQGTPLVTIKQNFDKQNKTYTLDIEQSIPSYKEKSKTLVIPMLTSLFTEKGASLPLEINNQKYSEEALLVIDKPKQSFTFNNINNRPVPSVFRSFSAPVNVKIEYTEAELILLLKHDTDLFNRYEAGQKLGLKVLLDLVDRIQRGQELDINEDILKAYGSLLDKPEDYALSAQALTLPSLTRVLENLPLYDVHAAFAAREFFIRELATELEEKLIAQYRELSEKKVFDITPESIGRRALKNLCLRYLSKISNDYIEEILRYFQQADNMTDELGGLSILWEMQIAESDLALKQFYSKWKNNFLVMNKWLLVQSSCSYGKVLEQVEKLENDLIFDKKNPNRLRALYMGFALNTVQFHHESYSGYQFTGNKIMEIDKYNPSIAARLAQAFSAIKKCDKNRQAAMKDILSKIKNMPQLSRNTSEVILNILEN